MKCDKLQRYTLDIDYEGNVISVQNDDGAYMDAYEVDAAIEELKARIQLDDDEMAGFLDLEEECGGGDLRNYIAELKAENERLKKQSSCSFSDDCLRVRQLKAKLEDVQASAYAEMVDAGMRERRLRRALWLARAERAIAEAEYWYGHSVGLCYIDAMEVPDEEDNPYKRVKDTTMGWYKTWMNVERKCRAKAEEYK